MPEARGNGCVYLGAGGPRGATHIEGQEGGGEEIHLVQGKEQQLSLARAAVKRYPTPKVRETEVRW